MEIKSNYLSLNEGEVPILPLEGFKLMRFSSKVSGGIATTTMQYPPTGNTHLPVSKKSISPYKMHFFNKAVLGPASSYLLGKSTILLEIP
jgi:hypothetical protein